MRFLRTASLVAIGSGLTLLTGDAFGWQCIPNSTCGCWVAPGNTLTYRIDISDFNSAGISALMNAADAWKSTGASDLRGANWEFIRGPDATSPAVGDFTNQIYKKPDSWFVDRSLGGTVALVPMTHWFCGRSDADIVFNSSKSYTTLFPSEHTSSSESISNVAIHEFGHVLGLDHVTVNPSLSIMLENGPISDIADGRYRINEDDYEGLVGLKPGTTTGKNLMLQRYRWWSGQLVGVPIWDSSIGDDAGSSGCPGDSLPAGDGPHDLNALVVGTATVSPLIHWRLCEEPTCTTGTQWIIGTRTPTMSANTPYEIGPAGGYMIPGSAPPGLYYVTAIIDPYDQISETNESDNSIVSGVDMFEVLDCP